MNTFRHSGKLGDIIYSLPAIKALGGGSYFVDHRTEHFQKPPLGEKSAQMMVDLLRTQSYIQQADLYDGRPVTCDLDRFREGAVGVHVFNSIRSGVSRIASTFLGEAGEQITAQIAPRIEMDLPQWHWECAGLPGKAEVSAPWISGIPGKRLADIVISKTDRHPGEFDWCALREFSDRAIFVGHEDEHRAFCATHFRVNFYKAADLVDFVRVVAGAKLFVGNQSFGLALADALRTPRVAQIWDQSPNAVSGADAYRHLSRELVNVYIGGTYVKNSKSETIRASQEHTTGGNMRKPSSQADKPQRTIETRPSQSGFSVDEAKELLGMCVVANYLGPVIFPPFPIGLRATADSENPLPFDDGRTYPYPESRIWPSGWTPGVPPNDSTRPWAKSIITSRLANGAPVNSAIIAFNASRNAYAVAFAGTLNPGAAMQDVSALLVPAGPVDLPYFKSGENYVNPFPAHAELPSGGRTYDPPAEPPEQAALVHLGYRMAVESLAVDPQTASNLRAVLANIESNEIDLYVTGHSLGAAVAQLFASWVHAGGVPSKKINVKCYSFATPKCCNTPMASNHGLALGNGGFSFRVENTLDTAPQLPPTKEQPTDLINPVISTDLGSKAEPTGLYASSPLAPLVKTIMAEQGTASASSGAPQEPIAVPFPFSIFVSIIGGLINAVAQAAPHGPPMSMDYVSMGMPHILAAQYPVVYDGRFYPPDLFPGRDDKDLVEIPDETTRQWWQHWPYNYAKYLAAA